MKNVYVGTLLMGISGFIGLIQIYPYTPAGRGCSSPCPTSLAVLAGIGIFTILLCSAVAVLIFVACADLLDNNSGVITVPASALVEAWEAGFDAGYGAAVEDVSKGIVINGKVYEEKK